MLSALLRAVPKSPDAIPDPEDYFYASLGLIFTDDLQNQHGDPDTLVHYRSNGYGDITFQVVDPKKENERTKFAHHVWNSGVLLGELVGGRSNEGGKKPEDEDWGVRKYVDGLDWWLDGNDEPKWSVRGETVIEFGAGVGLAGIMSLLGGAREVALTDYPADSILETLSLNVLQIVPEQLKPRISVHGHLWGSLDDVFATTHQGHYTRVLAADTLWLAGEHDNLARSMIHFLSPDPSARVLIIAGFHTGRAKIAAFFEEAVPQNGLEVEEIFDMNADGWRRTWDPQAAEQPVGERKKWLVLARLKRKQ